MYLTTLKTKYRNEIYENVWCHVDLTMWALETAAVLSALLHLIEKNDMSAKSLPYWQ